MLLPVESIVPNPDNARRIAPDPRADQALQDSIAALGLLEPLVVTPTDDPGTFTLRTGHRRLAAVRALGWVQVEVVVTANLTTPVAASAAENMVRAPMHPVDQWRALDRLIQDGCSMESGAAALGLTPTEARRINHLAHMAPEVIDALSGEPALPADYQLRAIALASHDQQRDALVRAAHRKGTDAGIVWGAVADACRVRRIPIARALFDVAAAGVTVDHDLFAEPGSEDEFTTPDVSVFLDRQIAAVEAQARESKGHMTAVPWASYMLAIPPGWLMTPDTPPKRWRKDDPRHVFAGVVMGGSDIGTVHYAVCQPKRKPVAQADTAPAPATPAPRPPISKATQGRIAAMKTDALRAFLHDVAGVAQPADMLRALLLVFCCRNVEAGGHPTWPARTPFPHVARALIAPDGAPFAPSHETLCFLAAQVIATAVTFDGPDSYKPAGAAPEWIARTLGVTAPRFDTADILKGVSGDTVMDLAEAHGVSVRGSASDVRKRLVGAMPNWQPMPFGAPGLDPENPDPDPGAPAKADADELADQDAD